MFPFVYGFTWNTGTIIFLGLFFTVVITVVVVFARALVRSGKDFQTGRCEAILWHEEFHDLSPSLRRCRHELTGEVKDRECPNEFDCRRCDVHPLFLANHRPAPSSTDIVNGFRMPADRFYHRGHTWVKTEDDGTMTIGIDDFASRVVGKNARMELPSPGTRIRANGTGWRMRRGDMAVRVLAPVDGEIIETANDAAEWVLRVRSSKGVQDLSHLLRGEEIRPWITREFERLQKRLAEAGTGETLADGGEPVEDFPKSAPDAPWGDVCGDVFLMV